MNEDAVASAASVEISREEDVVVVRLIGSFGETDAKLTLRDALASIVAGTEHQVLLDMAGCRYVDEEAIGPVCSLSRALMSGMGELKVAWLPPDLIGMFQPMRDPALFKLYPTRGEALAAFAAGI